MLLRQEPDAFTRTQLRIRILCQPHGWYDAVLHGHVPASRLGVEPRLGHIHDHTCW